MVGAIEVEFEYKCQAQPSECGWYRTLTPGSRLVTVDWFQFYKVDAEQNTRLEQILSKHAALFEPCLGKIAGTKAKFYLKKGAKPKFSTVGHAKSRSQSE